MTSLPLPERILWLSAFILLALFAVSLALHQLDGRQIGGVGVWVKPAKFQLSLALHAATLALAAQGLSGEWRGGRVLLVAALACVACGFFEIVYISIQAARGQGSHFNTASPFYAAMYGLMAVAAVIILLAAAVVGALALLDGRAPMGWPLRLGVGLGFLLGTALTLVVAFRLGGNGGHFVGSPPPGAAVMPLTGWSLAVGDLRVPHFFALHIMQALPLVALLAQRALAPGAAGLAVVVAAAGWVGLTLFTFRQALDGRPLLG